MMGGLSDFVGTIGGGAVGFLVGGPTGAAIGAGIGSGLDTANAAGDAAALAAGGAQAGLGETRRQFNVTQQNLQPFLEAATGTPTFEERETGRFRAFTPEEAQAARAASTTGLIGPGVPITERIQTGTEGGALQQFIQGIDQAPQAPTIQQFQGGAPQLEQFDINKALESPLLKFRQQMGEQQQDRLAGKNRLLGSGQRLIEGQKFGQGLASQAVGEEFNRQQLANQAALQQQDVDVGANQLQNQQLLQQFGLGQDAFNQRLNRLAGLVDVGRGAGSTLAQAGQAQAGNVSNLLQAQAQAQAAGRLGQTQGILGGLQQGVGLAAATGAFNQAPGGTAPPPTSSQGRTIFT